jgi:transposase
MCSPARGLKAQRLPAVQGGAVVVATIQPLVPSRYMSAAAPRLRRPLPALKRKDIVVMDNLPAHKVPGIREAIEARGATLRYLPQYSPDLNPIEMPFSKLKAGLRKAAERTVPRLCRRIGSFARRLSPAEAFNYFRHAGYA